MILASALLFVLAVALACFTFTLWASRWGATEKERSMPMAGDEYLASGPPSKTILTRAVTIDASVENVWPWLAQLGRGAGWYSYDLLDNGSRTSARHILSWIPPPREGDATASGYLRHVAEGRELTWWTPETRFLGSVARLVFDIRLLPEGKRSRLVIRMSADAEGGLPDIALSAFRFIDSVMARRELIGIRERVERYGGRTSNPDDPETGARDQYQLYEVIYASGESAGSPGKERARHWHRVAVEAGLAEDAIRA